MKWERRKLSASKNPEIKTTDLPLDYLRLVEKTLTQALEKGLTEMRKIHPISEFRANGALFSDEVVVMITLFHGEKNLAATTVYASADYDPNQVLVSSDPLHLDQNPGSTPMERVLGACVDAASATFDYYLDPTSPEKIEALAHPSLGTLDEAPFDWTHFEQTNPKVWVKMDKSNPILDSLADQWLNKFDPEFEKEIAAEEEALNVQEEFLEERLEAIKKARDGSGGSMGGSGPITH